MVSLLQEHFKGRHFRVLLVNVDKSKSAPADFAKERKMDVPFFWTPPADGLQDKYQASLLPTSYIINQDGIIVAKEYGPRRWSSDEVKKKISDLLLSPTR